MRFWHQNFLVRFSNQNSLFNLRPTNYNVRFTSVTIFCLGTNTSWLSCSTKTIWLCYLPKIFGQVLVPQQGFDAKMLGTEKDLVKLRHQIYLLELFTKTAWSGLGTLTSFLEPAKTTWWSLGTKMTWLGILGKKTTWSDLGTKNTWLGLSTISTWLSLDTKTTRLSWW